MPNGTGTRVGASRIRDIDPRHLAELNGGLAEARTLSEALAIDHRVLLDAAVPDAAPALRAAVSKAQDLGILKRMSAIGAALHEHLEPQHIASLAEHPSDTVRGWICFTIGANAAADIPAVLTAIKPLADDSCFTVREWAWMGIRPRLAAQLSESIGLLTPWTAHPSGNVRRFASEALRPRGVWAAHIPALKLEPERGEPLLQPLRADSDRYVQDSVANWINDAAKSRPDWAQQLCSRWAAQSPGAETARIVSRGLRSIAK